MSPQSGSVGILAVSPSSPIERRRGILCQSRRPALRWKAGPRGEIAERQPQQDREPEEPRARKRDDERAALAQLHEDRQYDQRLAERDGEREGSIECTQ